MNEALRGALAQANMANDLMLRSGMQGGAGAGALLGLGGGLGQGAVGLGAAAADGKARGGRAGETFVSKLREELSGSALETVRRQMSDAIDDASFSLQVGKPERTTELKARLA